MEEFVHLHNHTEYSLLDGACRISDNKGNPSELFHLISKEYKMPALAITDHGNMFGAIEFFRAAAASGIKPIIGCEVYVVTGSRFSKEIDKVSGEGKYYHLTLLAKNYQGYKNLMRMVSAGWTEGFYYKPRIDREILEKYHEGIIAMSGCLAGEIASAFVKRDKEKALKAAGFYNDIFGKDNFYIEIMDNGLEQQQKIIPDLLELSKTTGIPLAATNDCHFLRQADAKYHDILLCIGTKRNLSDTNRFKMESDQFYYKSPQEMAKLFGYVPQAVKNTLVIAEKTNIMSELNELLSMNNLLLPKFPIPKEYKDDKEYLVKLCNEGLKRRYGSLEPKHQERLDYELSVINKMGFASYFLIVWDFIKYAKDNGISVGPGRGSGAGAMVAYTLGITDICPLTYGLMFERFLNPDRISMPDLDIDISDKGRDDVINYVRKKYGAERCAQIITFGSMQAKNAIKDTARVMGFTPQEGQNLANFIVRNSTISESIEQNKDFAHLVKTDERISNLVAAASKLEGLKRNTGIHAAGMIIADEEIINYSPLAKGKDDIITTQYDGVILPDLGLLKVDFLGLKTLSVIDACVKMIKEKNPNFDVDKISLEDKATYELLQSARTFGVFQLESKGMRDVMRSLKPSSVNDIIALIALYRPGPMDLIPDFISRKHGKTLITYDHPLQEPILKETYGISVYQEQAMKMTVELAGFTGGEADTLRKAMSKKKLDTIEKMRDKFIEGAKLTNGINSKIAKRIFDNIAKFAGYGFNKSHAAAYGMLSYRTAYLKANYPMEYMTAMLNSQIGSVVKEGDDLPSMTTYIDDVKDLKIKILPPDIRYSSSEFRIENDGIRFGILAIKGVGSGVTEAVEKARNELGNFKNFDDFLQKMPDRCINKKALENFAKAGAFDCFGDSKDIFQTRADILANIGTAVDNAAKVKKEKESAQVLLFSEDEAAFNAGSLKKIVPPLEYLDALKFEREVLDFYVSGHPLDKYKKELIFYSNYRLDKLPALKPNNDFKSAQTIRIVGMISGGIKRAVSKKNKKPYASFKIEDLYGSIDAMVFSQKLDELWNYLVQNNVIVAKGLLMGVKEEPYISIDKIWTIDEAKKEFPPNKADILINISTERYDENLLEELFKIFVDNSGKSKVFFNLEDSKHGNFLIETKYNIEYSDKIANNIEEVIGIKDCVELSFLGKE
jgi:DNA polymerase-3 subunit alpha